LIVVGSIVVAGVVFGGCIYSYWKKQQGVHIDAPSLKGEESDMYGLQSRSMFSEPLLSAPSLST
jgi:hypothetical protein